jgi:hypothetical protein
MASLNYLIHMRDINRRGELHKQDWIGYALWKTKVPPNFNTHDKNHRMPNRLQRLYFI